ncbi:MAG: hypothetical protein ACI4N3_03540 [Alphaproteobacteria bacterium]
MKFTIEDVCKELAKRLTPNGEKLNLSERSIKEQAETLLPIIANEDMELADFVEKIFPIFKTADNNIRNDVSLGIKDFKDKNPIPKPQVKEEKPNKEPSEVEKRLAELEKRLADADKKSLIEKRKSDIIEKMKEKGVTDVTWINSLLEEVNLDVENFDVDARSEKYLTMYNKKVSKVNTNVTPNSANSNESADKKRIMSKIKDAKKFADSQSLNNN